MANLGIQPTFNGHAFQIEVHIFDFHQHLRICVGSMFSSTIAIRKSFSNTSDLIKQLQIDKQKSMDVL